MSTINNGHPGPNPFLASPAPSTGPRLPVGWYPDPLDQSVQRYFDGVKWTFWTAEPAPRVEQEAPPEPTRPTPKPALREDIAEAVEAASGLMGAGKEIRLLEQYLRPEERVAALAAAVGTGTGVLVCTNQRLLFLFVGIVNKQVLEVSWNEVKHIVYDRSSKVFATYDRKPTRRAQPWWIVRVPVFNDALRVAQAAESAAAAPRLETV